MRAACAEVLGLDRICDIWVTERKFARVEQRGQEIRLERFRGARSILLRSFMVKFQNTGVTEKFPETSREKIAGFMQRTEKKGRLWTSNR